MIALSHRIAKQPRVPLGVLLLTLAVAGFGQVLRMAETTVERDPAGSAVGTTDAHLGTGAAPLLDPSVPAGGSASAERARIRENVTFWGTRFAADPRDFISATRLAASEIELARATGDVTGYLAANEAVDGALRAFPEYPVALGYRGVVLVALHRFEEARDQALAILAVAPADPTALAILGDASLELGHVAAARTAYADLATLGASPAASVRLSHLAFIEGRIADAVLASEAAVSGALEQGLNGSVVAWYHYQLGDTRIATGNRAGAAEAYRAALLADPASHLARWGLSRIAAAEGRLDDAIAQLDAAIKIMPQLEFVARRADLYRLRGAEDDTAREAADRATVLAIAGLAAAAGTVHDRTLSLYLAGSGDDPARALSLAAAEIDIRPDVYGYDALAWALLANDRPEEARVAMATALAFGTRDARLLYHAGMIALALGERPQAASLLRDALDLDPSFDPLAVALASAVLAELQ